MYCLLPLIVLPVLAMAPVPAPKTDYAGAAEAMKSIADGSDTWEGTWYFSSADTRQVTIRNAHIIKMSPRPNTRWFIEFIDEGEGRCLVAHKTGPDEKETTLVSQGIYKYEDGTLTVCWKSLRQRPKIFEAENGQGMAAIKRTNKK